MSCLINKKCTTCEKGTKPLHGEELFNYVKELGGNWKLINEHHLEKEYLFKNFKDALDFTNVLGAIAQQEGHHPDIHLSWGKVRVILWTHSVNGLSENDFILASKFDQI